MNNKDILNELNYSADDFLPSDRLTPDSIEKSLSNVKRRSYKGVATACASLAVVCLTVIGVGTVMLKTPTQQAPIVNTEAQNNTYADIYTVVEDVKKKNQGSFLDGLYDLFSSDVVYESMVDGEVSLKTENSLTNSIGAVSQDVTTVGASQSVEHSETNNQVQGVDEADIVKTDGNYIYSVNDKRIFITNPNNGAPTQVSTIMCSFNISDIYIHANTLVAISEHSVYSNEMIYSEETDDYYYDHSPADIFTRIFVYDLTDVNAPVLKSELSQTGNYVSSRKIDNVLYLTTRYNINNYEQIEEEEPETYCPLYGTPTQMECVPSNDIVIGENTEEIQYISVGSVDLNNPDNFADISSVLGSGYNMYASLNNIYVSSSSYEDGSESTQILRFSINGTDIEQNGTLTVDGRLLNQFSMDEYNGYFRVVTQKTEYEEYANHPNEDVVTNSRVIMSDNDSMQTALYVFDSNLNQVGKTDDVAKGESVKSVRFDGDIAYFVTFRQTDPLFTVDLSNPTNPQILSELKIPGFSQYMHPFGDGLLLGFGREADPETGVTQGLKLTMFNTSDKTNVTELATKVFTDEFVTSPATYSHKAIFVDVENNIIGIPYSSYDDGVAHYVIFKYDAQTNEFVQCKDLTFTGILDQYFNYKAYDYIRGLYIGEYFYAVTPQNVYSYKYQTFEDASSLSLN